MYSYLYYMAEKKDPRYKAAKVLIGAKHIKTFKEIFDHIPKSVIAKELHTNNNRMSEVIEDAAHLRVGEVAKIAKLIGVPFMVIAGLVDAGLKNGKA
jgi:hypothetical protein